MSIRGNVTAVIGRNLASSLGRKGTVSDVTLYNNKTGDVVLSFVEPSSYPDKIQSLTSALNMADQVLCKVSAIDAAFAETVVTLDALDMRRGYLILEGDITREAMAPLLKGTCVEGYEVVEEQVMELRKKLTELDLSSEGDAIVQVDHSFNVKGVGTVALGVVKQGVVKKYEELSIYPSKEKALVKSIQVHDNDMAEAVCGVRVGLSLKNTKPEDVPRGTILSTGEIRTLDEIELESTTSKYYPKGLHTGDQIMVNCALNHVPAKVVSGEVATGGTGRLTLKLDRPTPILPKKRMAFLDPGQKMPRVFGFGTP